MNNDLVTFTQAEYATDCAISRFTLRKLVRDKKIEARKIKGQWYVPMKAVAELIASGNLPRRGRPMGWRKKVAQYVGAWHRETLEAAMEKARGVRG